MPRLARPLIAPGNLSCDDGSLDQKKKLFRQGFGIIHGHLGNEPAQPGNDALVVLFSLFAHRMAWA